MYTLLRSLGFRKGLLAETPSLVLSLILAEVFYKFHSFTLECVAFLATWFAIGHLVSSARNAWSGKSGV